MEQRSLKRSREQYESSSSNRSGGPERLQRIRRENGLPMQDTGSSQKINDDKREKTPLEFLTPGEHKTLNNGLRKDASQRDMKESLAIKIFEISIKHKNNNESDLFIERLLREIREDNLYKQAYGSEGSSPHQQVKREELNTREAHDKADQHGPLPLLEQVKQGLVTPTQRNEGRNQADLSRQADAQPARTEKRKSHQTLGKYQRQDTASSSESLEDFAARLEAKLRKKEDQADARPARAEKRQNTILFSSKSLKDVSARLEAEFTKKDTPIELNKDDPKELVVRKIHCNVYRQIISSKITTYLKKAEQGKGRYTKEELLKSKEKLEALKTEIINGTEKAYDALQGIIKNPSNDPEKSAAQLLVYHMTRKD